jgi:predicted dehydrogenase
VRAYVEADRAFVDALLSGRPPEPGLDVALEAHRLVDAAYRSAAGGGAPVGVSSTRG